MASANSLTNQFSFDSLGPMTNGDDTGTLPGAPSFGATGPSDGGSAKAPSFFANSVPGSDPSAAAAPSTPSASYNSAPAPQASASAPASSQPDFAGMLTDLKATTDPSQAAVKQDQLARLLFQQLSTAGHEVKWQGDQLIVDGRPYLVGGGADGSLPDTGVQTTQVQPQWAELPPSNDATLASAPQASAIQQQYPTMDPRLAQLYASKGITPGGSGAGFTDWQYWNDKIKTGDADYFLNRLSADLAGNGTDQPGPGDAGNTSGRGQAGNPGTILNDTGPSPFAGPPPGVAAAPPAPSWQPGQGPTYTPGDISFDDIPKFSYDDLYRQILGNDPTDAQTQQLIGSILDNPDSIDAHTLDMMKAKSKDELAEQQAQEEGDMRAYGNAAGIDDSNWLASERLASKRGRDQSVVSSNRNLELQAATTNAQDRRAAAQLGASYGAQKAQIRQAAATLAADTTLRQAAATNDRMALRESVKQKAAELGINADQVMSSYLLGLADNATRRYGIDVGAQIDWAKLKEQSSEFKEDLAMRLAQLNQQSDQFNLNYGLDFAKFSHTVDQDNYNRSVE